MIRVDLATRAAAGWVQFADARCEVGSVGPAHAMTYARADDLNRCVPELVENAAPLDTEVTIGRTLAADGMVIKVGMSVLSFPSRTSRHAAAFAARRQR
jgi:hypothetical protein